MSAPRVVATHHVSFGGGEPEHSGSLLSDERFPIASITKTLTGLLAARLGVDGTVSWDMPIGPSTGITLRALLTHTAGVPFELHPDHWVSSALTDAGLDAAFADPPRLRVPPGTWHYSNLGYAIAARVLERGTGRPYADLLDEYVVGPLGMAHTSFPVAGEPGPLLGAAGPAGDLWSTIADLVTLASALNGDHPAVVTGPMIRLLLASTVSAPGGDDLGPGFRSRRVGLHRILASTGTIRDLTTCVVVWPRRGAAVLVAEAGHDHHALVDAGVQHWVRDDVRARTWWWDGQEVAELCFGDEVELRLLETSWPFALFTGHRVADRLVGVGADGLPLVLADHGHALEAEAMRLTSAAGDSAFPDVPRP